MMLKKIKDNKAFSLIEVTATIIIVLLVTSLCVLAVNVSTNHYKTITRQSEARLISSTLVKKVQDELRFAGNIEGTGTDVKFYSRSRLYRDGCVLKAVNGHIAVVYEDEKDDDKDAQAFLIPEADYVFLIKSDITVNYDGDNFDVELTVYSDDGEINYVKNFVVSPLNG